MGELGQNKQPTTHLGKIQKYKYKIQKYKYKIQNNGKVNKVKETINDLLGFQLTACEEQNVSNITIILFHVRKSLCVH